MRNVVWILTFFVLAPVPGQAQTPLASWANLSQLRSGQRTEVVDTHLRTLRGTFVALSDEALTLRVGKSDVAVRRAEVFRVTDREHSHRTRNMLLGLAVGSASGLAIAQVASDVDEGPFLVLAPMIGVGVGAGAGLGAGAALPAGCRTIYRAEPSRGPRGPELTSQKGKGRP